MQQQAEQKNNEPIKHNSVDITPGMTVEDYVSKSVKMHYGSKHEGMLNGGMLQFCRKIGDMALAVIPKNRFWCAVGLTSGGFAGLHLGGLLAGKRLYDHKPIDIDKVHPIFKPLHGLLNYNEHSSAPADRWKRVAALFTFTAVSFVGVMSGAYYAYRNSRIRNENPQSLEDYAARVGQHQGDKWRWLSASSGVFGSSAGTYMVPYVPGVNYAISIASYTVLNQDRKMMTPGLRGLSGAKTMSYLGLREGLDYICKYSVNNPSRDPAELEFLALTVMGPLFDAAGKKLEPECIKHFVDKVHEVRDKYWQDGGIPRDLRKIALKDMDAHFKGKGLDKTLYECGLDTTDIDFTRLNGLVGKVGNKLGAESHISKEQEAYRAKVAQWRTEWLKPAEVDKDHTLTPAQELAQAPAKAFAREELRKSYKPATPRPASHIEAARHSHANDDILSSSL